MTGELQHVKKRVSKLALLARKNAGQIVRYGITPRGAELHVFVAGVQRSGTNMVMDVLEASPETSVFHESDKRAFRNFIMKEREVIHRLAKESRAPCFVIKSLCESQELHELLDDFPPARALWVFRHYHDVVNSMLRSFREHAVHIQRMAEDRESAGWRGRRMSDETHGIVRRFADSELQPETAAALMWYLRNVLFFELGLNRDPRVCLVHYESLVKDPASEFRRMFELMSLDYEESVAEEVRSTSVGKHEAPRIAPEVRTLCDELYERLVEARKAAD